MTSEGKEQIHKSSEVLALRLKDSPDTTKIDDAVLQYLPIPGTVAQVEQCGFSGWATTSKVTIAHTDGTEGTYFLKTCSADVARVMMEGEFHSLKLIRDVLPSFAPKPYGWGECKSSPGTYFLLMEFLNLEETLNWDADIPDVTPFIKLVTDMHRNAVSPTGKFGFWVPTCHGAVIQPNDWDASWSRFFTRLITVFFETDIKTNGSDPEFEQAFATLKEHVIPRLLEPLQAEGRTIKPSLVHGDLWHGNVGKDEETQASVVFDAACFFAHHEYELGMWRRARCAFDEDYIQAYENVLPPSEPKEEKDDRQRLYSIKFNLAHKIHWQSQFLETRQMILDDMVYLNKKYAPCRHCDRKPE